MRGSDVRDVRDVHIEADLVRIPCRCAMQMHNVYPLTGWAQPFPITPLQPARKRRMRSRSIGVAVAHPAALIGHDLRATEPEAGNALGNLRRICMVACIHA